MTDTGDLDYDILQQKLNEYRNYNSLKVCAISAGSNLTGIMFDVDRISVMCHKADFVVCFDYAAVCPYTDINFNGITKHYQSSFMQIAEEDLKYAYKDAMFISPHKLVGGPGSSGLLIAKRDVMKSWRPQRLGGGIVFFVNGKDHEFIADKEEREESGTPGIIQDIRAGLVFQLKEAVGAKTIIQKEEEFNEKIMNRLQNIENLILLGNNNLVKAAIYSFHIKSRGGKLLHPNFVVNLLNDLFGIQTRAGCQCSPMQGQSILGIDVKTTREMKDALMNGYGILRVGFTRINFNYFADEKELDYILNALEFICKYGWMLLP